MTSGAHTLLLFCSLLKCCNPVISFYLYEVSNKRKLLFGSLSRSSSSSVLCFKKWKKGRILLTTWRTSTVKKMSLRKFVQTVPRNLSAVLQEFMRMRVEWCNIIIMLVTCALKRRNGTHTKRNILNGTFKDIWDAIFTFICKSEYIRMNTHKPGLMWCVLSLYWSSAQWNHWPHHSWNLHHQQVTTTPLKVTLQTLFL